MKFKDGVYTEVMQMRDNKPSKLIPSQQIQAAMHAADSLSKAIAKKEIVITAIFDGTHMSGSKHYTGNAFDMRRNHYTPKELDTLLENLRGSLLDFDVVLEATHIHVEYDPK